MGKITDMVSKLIREALEKEFASQRQQLREESASILHDITYRMGVLKETAAGIGDRVHTSDLNIATHMIDGYVVTNDSPSAGSVAWTDVNIVYKGTTYTLTNGNTANKYLYWTLASTPTTMKTSATKPTLSNDDILIGVNEGGKFTLTMAPGKLTPGSALMDGSVGSNELGAKAVTQGKIGDLAVGSGQLGSGAVTTGKIGSGAIDAAGLFKSGVVDSTALGSGAVTAGKIGSGAINASGLFTANVVDTNAINTGAVTSNELGANAVVSGKIASGAISNANAFTSGVVGSTALGTGAVTAGKIAAGGVSAANQFATGVVDSTALGTGAVTAGKIGSGAINGSGLFTSGVVNETALGSGAVTGTKLGAGAVAEDKLNVATHFLF